MAKMNGDHGKERALDFSKMVSIIWKNWLVISRDKFRLVMLLLFPIIMISIFGYTSGATPKYISAAIVDYDHSTMSQTVTDALYSSQLFSIKRQFGSQDEGRKSIDSGEIKALFIIPEGLESDIAAGKGAVLYAIFDQSDPSIAQITRASTQVFVQQLSQSLLQRQIAGAAGEVQSAQQDLAAAKRTMVIAMDSKAVDSAVSSADANYRDATFTSSRLVSGVSTTSQALRNTVGYLINSNEIIDLGITTHADAAPASYLLSTAAAQSSTLAQVAYYNGIMGGVSRITVDTGKIYSSTKTMAAISAADDAAVSAAYKSLESADGKLSSVSSELSSANPAQLSMSVIEPYGSSRPSIDFLLPSMLAMTVFQGATAGLGRAIAGERKDGSLTRVFMTPTSNTTIIVGTQLFYLGLEIARSIMLIIAATLMFGVTMKGSFLDMIPIIVIYAMGAVGIGMVISVLSKNQEQYMAFSMLITIPTMFLSGVFLPIQTMPPALQSLASVLPITYAADAFRAIMIKGFTIGAVVPDLVFLTAFAFVTVAASLVVFKRELV
ncbi:ABC-2 family transporter protein [uncultured archaeon]|nr:ABC-2 family transporter protein [uncultured archaeon]